MATYSAIDQHLLIQAQKLGNHKTKKETVNRALENYIIRFKQIHITRLFGKIDYDSDYNYKKGRSRK